MDLSRPFQKIWITCLIEHPETKRPREGERLASEHTASERQSGIKDRKAAPELDIWILRPPDMVPGKSPLSFHQRSSIQRRHSVQVWPVQLLFSPSGRLTRCHRPRPPVERALYRRVRRPSQNHSLILFNKHFPGTTMGQAGSGQTIPAPSQPQRKAWKMWT